MLIHNENQEKLNIWSAWEQANSNRGIYEPIIVIKRNGRKTVKNPIKRTKYKSILFRKIFTAVKSILLIPNYFFATLRFFFKRIQGIQFKR